MDKTELSDLAQHQYLVAFIGWQLARYANRNGARINTERVMELGMIHDLGELFGGDLNFYYARANPEARKSAKQLEDHNHKFLSQFFLDDQGYYLELVKEEKEQTTSEACITKIADYVECMHYKQYKKCLSKYDLETNIGNEIIGFIDKYQTVMRKKRYVLLPKIGLQDLLMEKKL